MALNRPTREAGSGKGLRSPDAQFADIGLAGLYDLFHPPEKRADFAFYLPMVMSAKAVLDVGCGTGALLCAARRAGHVGRLVGLDPALGMIEQARRHSGIEWVLGDMRGTRWDAEFDLVVMTGHAFQVLVDDTEIGEALVGVSRALEPCGRFVFETRNALAREWETWNGRRIEGITTDGVVVLERYQVDAVEDGVVHFVTTFESPSWREPRFSESTLRFATSEELVQFLTRAGLEVEEQFGDWDRQPVTESSPEVITVAVRR
jgi:ubiquinone/menaquinone biosynthesis C-methylase UbiE